MGFPRSPSCATLELLQAPTLSYYGLGFRGLGFSDNPYKTLYKASFM